MVNKALLLRLAERFLPFWGPSFGPSRPLSEGLHSQEKKPPDNLSSTCLGHGRSTPEQDAEPPADACRRCGVTMRDRARGARYALCPVPMAAGQPEVSEGLAAVWRCVRAWRAAAGGNEAPALPEPPPLPAAFLPTWQQQHAAEAAWACSADVHPVRPCLPRLAGAGTVLERHR